MSYKGLIIKIQALQANYDREIEETRKKDIYYTPFYTKEVRLAELQKFSNELDKILESEVYRMKKHFKYL